MTRRGNRGSFGAPHRSVKDHERAQRQAAIILELEHGLQHEPGARGDLCPTCIAEREAAARPKEETP